ncbi:DUF2804 domain-containing protein [Agromyces aureus]|uniref:Glycosyl hydrolase family 2 n=1 Tax=Agromyces aureus TaxID=453304 RepID=A0A191WKD5_9MICO|nr:DUF2804 domain-containing protein [Agromyces aureus]ANJ28639.1 glycosyl hydrolase family 2 [Agromyces aureus]
MPRTTVERELTGPVALVGADGRLNPEAVGWTRMPLHDTSGIDGRHAWGRNKRWEYWAVTTPTHVIALTVSSLDYAAVHAVLVHDRRTGATIDRSAIAPLGSSAVLPASLGDGPARAVTRTISIDLDEVDGGTRLRATSGDVRLDILAHRPVAHESLGVVVPWSATRFQYTVKDVARPASGWLEVAGERIDLPAGESWAVLDHGRGRWPYRMTWNWGAASGPAADGRTIGLQLGGKWTDGTGSTENAVLVDGRLHKIGDELEWAYDEHDWLAPWRIHGASVDLRFEPFWDRVSSTELLVFGSHGHQCFGHYSGWVAAGGERIAVDGLLGWAEEVRNRW